MSEFLRLATLLYLPRSVTVFPHQTLYISINLQQQMSYENSLVPCNTLYNRHFPRMKITQLKNKAIIMPSVVGRNLVYGLLSWLSSSVLPYCSRVVIRQSASFGINLALRLGRPSRGRYAKGMPSCSLAALGRPCASPLAVTAAIVRRRNPNALRH